jgi:hypothetical protein
MFFINVQNLSPFTAPSGKCWVVKTRLVERVPKVRQLEGALEVLTKAFPSHQAEKTRVSKVDQDA